MEKHREQLQKLCRLCGKKRGSLRKISDKTSFLIDRVYSYDVKEDTLDVHPTKCCLSCFNKVTRYFKHASKKGGSRGQPPLPPLYTFSPHGDACQICFQFDSSQATAYGGGESPDLSSGEDADYSTQCADQQTQTSVCCFDIQTQTDISLTAYRDQSPQQQNLTDHLQQSEYSLDGLDHKTLVLIAHSLGKSQHQSVKSDYLHDTSMKDMSSVVSLSPNSYVTKQNPVIVAFLLGISNKELSSLDKEDTCYDEKKIYTMCKTVESVVNLAMHRVLLPLHVRDSLLVYAITGSRLALTILGSSSCHASYASVKKFLSSLAGSVSKDSLSGDVVFAFDNNQVLHRAWNVNIESKFRCHIVTMVVQFQVDKEGSLQWRQDLRPGIWMPGNNFDVTNVKLLDQERNIKKLHYDNHLYPFILDVITNVASEQKLQNANGETTSSEFVDHIDDSIERKKQTENFKQCYSCGDDKIQRTKIKCPSCKINLKQSELKARGLTEYGTWEDKIAKKQGHHAKAYKVTFEETHSDSVEIVYTAEQQEHVNRTPNSFKVSEPVFVNPCSYEACGVVLRNIGREASVTRYGGEREYVNICCDGSPYVLCARLVLSTYICSLCGESVSGINQSTAHVEMHVSKEEVCQMDLEFDWVILIPGPGHLEMNMVKSYVELTWHIFWKQLAQLMNFRSENALNAVKRVSDHHKGWQMCTIVREAMSRELVLPWVRMQLTADKPDLSPDTFFKFMMCEVKDQTYTMIGDLLFELLDSIFMYRKGIRDDLPEYSYAARAKVAKIWTGRPHPNYREIEMTDNITLARMPDELRQNVLNCWCINTSGTKGTSQGPDFKLEEVNRQTQAWLPKVPTGNDWSQVCGNFESLSELRKNTLLQLGIKDPKEEGKSRPIDKTEEINAFRCLLRENKYLLNPKSERGVISLDGQTLSPDMVNFCKLSREKRARYFEAFMEFEPNRSLFRSSVPFREPPVFVTIEEETNYNSIKSKTIKELKEIISSKLQDINDAEVIETFESALSGDLLIGTKSTKGKKTRRLVKADYLQVLAEISDYLEYQNSSASPIPDSLNECDDDDN